MDEKVFLTLLFSSSRRSFSTPHDEFQKKRTSGYLLLMGAFRVITHKALPPYSHRFISPQRSRKSRPMVPSLSISQSPAGTELSILGNSKLLSSSPMITTSLLSVRVCVRKCLVHYTGTLGCGTDGGAGILGLCSCSQCVMLWQWHTFLHITLQAAKDAGVSHALCLCMLIFIAAYLFPFHLWHFTCSWVVFFASCSLSYKVDAKCRVFILVRDKAWLGLSELKPIAL